MDDIITIYFFTVQNFWREPKFLNLAQILKLLKGLSTWKLLFELELSEKWLFVSRLFA